MKKITSLILALVMALSLTVTALAAEPVIIKGDAAAFGAATKTWNVEVPAGFDGTKAPTKEADVTATYYVKIEWSFDGTNTLKYVDNKANYSWKVLGAGDADATTTETDPTHAGYAVSQQWEGTAKINVKVTNWSNRAMKADMEFAPVTTVLSGETTGVTKAIKVDETGCLTWVGFDGTAATQTAGIIVNSAANGVPFANDTNAVTAGVAGSGSLTIDGTKLGGAINANDTVIGTLTITLAEKTA